MNATKGKKICIVVIIVIFFGILLFNNLTPYMSDDFCYDPGIWKGWEICWNRAIDNYLTWNGRLIPQLLMNIALSIPKYVFNIVNSICYVLLVVCIYLNAKADNTSCDYPLLFVTGIMIYLFSVAPGQTLLWVAGSCNYLWATVLSFGFLTFFRHCLKNNTKFIGVKNVIFAIVMFLFGVIAGWCNENTSGGILLIVFFSVIEYIKPYGRKTNLQSYIREIPSWAYSGAAGMCTGLFALVFSPGGMIRLEQNALEENQTGVFAYFGRILKLNDYVKDDFGILIIAITFLILFVYANARIDYYSIALVVASIITIYVLVLTPTPMDRALFGAGIMLIVAVLRIGIIALSCGDKVITSLVKSVCIVLILVFIHSYLSNGANLIRINRELKERDAFVEEQIDEGKEDLILPKVRTEWENKYTFIYLNDISEDSSDWGNYLYRTYYGVHEIVGVSRDDWDDGRITDGI